MSENKINLTRPLSLGTVAGTITPNIIYMFVGENPFFFHGGLILGFIALIVFISTFFEEVKK